MTILEVGEMGDASSVGIDGEADTVKAAASRRTSKGWWYIDG
jgi:hypothetical protein